MQFYNRDILETHRRRLARSRVGGRGDWLSLIKFVIIFAFVFGVVGFILREHNSSKQRIAELHKTIRSLQQTNQELEKRVQVRYTELESLRVKDNIAERARALGLRPAKSSQIVRDIHLVWSDGVLRANSEVARR